MLLLRLPLLLVISSARCAVLLRIADYPTLIGFYALWMVVVMQLLACVFQRHMWLAVQRNAA